MVQRPLEFGAFEFVILASQRAAQLMRGCTPRVESTHKTITTAQMEVAQRRIVRAVYPAPVLEFPVAAVTIALADQAEPALIPAGARLA